MTTSKTNRLLGAAIAIAGLASLSATSGFAQTFTEGGVAGTTSSDTWGQGFVVGLEATPDPGLTEGDEVTLVDFTSYRASAGFGDPDADVYLVITEGTFFDWNGELDDWTPTTADLVAVSTNSFNPSTLAANDAMTFTFDSSAVLLAGSNYGAVYATIDENDMVTPVQVGSIIGDWYEDELLGIWLPVQNHGDQELFEASALFADYDGEGSLDGCQLGCDISFLVTFSVGAGLEGDLNGDGFVGLDDLDIILTAWNQSVTAGSEPDPSGDGFVGLDDLDLVLNNWNAGTAPAAAVVPEPATLGLLSLGGLALLRRK